MKVKKKKTVFMILNAHEAFSMAQFLFRLSAHDEPLLRP